MSARPCRNGSVKPSSDPSIVENHWILTIIYNRSKIQDIGKTNDLQALILLLINVKCGLITS